MLRRLAHPSVLTAIVVLASVLLAGPEPASAAEARPTERPGRLTPNQLVGGQSLTSSEAQAACGPAAAVAFAQATGRAISLDTAVAVAREVGWTPARGMTGPYGELSLLQRLNIPATLEVGVSSAKVVREVQAGRPVIIRTSGQSAAVPGHYFVAEQFDASIGRFDLAQSALVLRSAGGRRWFSLDEIASLGTGTPTHAFYLASGAGAEVTTMAVRSATRLIAQTGTATAGSRVVATGGPGARLRSAPGTASSIVGAVADGTRVTPTGASAVVSGRTWQQVTVAGGGAAWVDASLLRAS
jgi:hypothetical protein